MTAYEQIVPRKIFALKKSEASSTFFRKRTFRERSRLGYVPPERFTVKFDEILCVFVRRTACMRSGFVHRRLVQPVRALLTQGVTPEKIALSLALGMALGVFPVIGSTTVLCALAAVVLRLNLPAIQLVNYFVYPLQLMLLVPFVRMGERLFRARPLQLSPQQMVAMFRADLLHAIATLWRTALQAASAWLLVSPLLLVMLYFVFLLLIRTLAPANPVGFDASTGE